MVKKQNPASSSLHQFVCAVVCILVAFSVGVSVGRSGSFLSATTLKSSSRVAVQRQPCNDTTPANTNHVQQSVVESAVTTTAPNPSGCNEIIIRMHAWNSCWRQHMMKEANMTGLIPCHISSKEQQVDWIGAPMYILGYYGGQGFGRVVDHTTKACMIAFLLKRPCLINLQPRDRHYTFRSFVQPTTYNWDPSILSRNYESQLDALLQQLEKIGHGDWGDENNFDQDAYVKANPLVYPMHQHVDAKHTWLYRAGPDNIHSHKVLVSPNWGNAWFPNKIPYHQLYPDQYQCPFTTLITKTQNALYGPTHLLEELHEARIDAAVQSGKWKGSNAQTAETLIPHPDLQIVPKDIFYGAIHIRLHFLNQGREDKPTTAEEIVTMVQDCLQQAFQQSTATTGKNVQFPQNWWLLADEPNMAVRVGIALEETQQGSNTSVPLIGLYHNYNISTTLGNTTDDLSFKEFSSEHSNSLLARGLYGHVHMAGAVQDWMALQQSKITIVTPAGVYGLSGARGHDKVAQGGSCGEQKFQIYY